MDIENVVDRLRAGFGHIPDEEHDDLREVLEAATSIAKRLREDGSVDAAESDPELKKRLGGVAERMGRRDGHGLAVASLARALLAILAGRPRDAEESLKTADQQLTLFGL